MIKTKRTSFLQKAGLVLLGVFVALICLELGMRITGWAIFSLQEHRNLQAIQKKGTYRIMCLGESTTQGQYPSFLEEELNRKNIGIQFSVIDKGHGGTDTSFIVTNLENYLYQYQPDMVVAMMGINDSDRFLKADLEKDSFGKIFLSSFKVYRLARFVIRHLASKFQGQERTAALAIDRFYARCPSTPGRPLSLDQIMREDEALRKAIESQPGNPRIFIEQARRYIHEGQGAKAEQLIRQAIRLQPENSDNYIELSHFYELNSRVDEAEQTLLNAPRQDESIYLALARIYRSLGKEDRVEEVLRQAVRVSADRGLDWPHSELASLFLDQGRLEEAEAEARKAVALNPKNNWALVRLAKILSQKGAYQEAEELMAKAGAVDVQDQWFVVFQQAMMLASHGKMEEAVQKAKMSLEMNPQSMEGRGFLYNYYRQKGDKEKAEEMLDSAIAANPSLSLWAIGELAVLHYEKNDWDYVRRFRADYWEGKKHPRKRVFYQPLTRKNFRRIKEILDQKGIRFVAVQYPTRELKPLRDIFAGEENIIFVDNEQIFRTAVMQNGFKTYFADMFALDFGHCTDEGNRLLAQNIADTILREVFHR